MNVACTFCNLKEDSFLRDVVVEGLRKTRPALYICNMTEFLPLQYQWQYPPVSLQFHQEEWQIEGYENYRICCDKTYKDEQTNIQIV